MGKSNGHQPSPRPFGTATNQISPTVRAFASREPNSGQDETFRFSGPCPEAFARAVKKQKEESIDIIVGNHARAVYAVKKAQGYTAAVFYENGGIKYLKGQTADLKQAAHQQEEPFVAFLVLDDTFDDQLAAITAKGSGFALLQQPFIAPVLLRDETVPTPARSHPPKTTTAVAPTGLPDVRLEA
jgi:hypothetical protein